MRLSNYIIFFTIISPKIPDNIQKIVCQNLFCKLASLFAWVCVRLVRDVCRSTNENRRTFPPPQTDNLPRLSRMDDFGETIMVPTGEEDAAAEFLAREQDHLQGLEEELAHIVEPSNPPAVDISSMASLDDPEPGSTPIPSVGTCNS